MVYASGGLLKRRSREMRVHVDATLRDGAQIVFKDCQVCVCQHKVIETGNSLFQQWNQRVAAHLVQQFTLTCIIDCHDQRVQNINVAMCYHASTHVEAQHRMV